MDHDSENTVSLTAIRELRKAEAEDLAYQARILSMSKVELLNEMVAFQEERAKAGVLSAALLIRGRVLFRALEEHAETDALRALTRSYRRHLEYEIQDYKKTGKRVSDQEDVG